MGIPTAVICSDEFGPLARAESQVLGLGNLPLVGIPHPLVGETASRLAGKTGGADVRFIHLNHTNRLLWNEEARRALRGRGFRVAVDGEDLPL